VRTSHLYRPPLIAIETGRKGSKVKNRKIEFSGRTWWDGLRRVGLLKHGHDVMLSNSRTPDTLFTYAQCGIGKIG